MKGMLGELTEGAWWLAVQDIAPRDTGKLEEWALSLVFKPTRLITLEDHPQAAIPDDQPFGVERVLRVEDLAVVKKITVGLDITHPFTGDLQVSLASPQGKEAILHNRRGGATDNILRTYSSLEFSALQPLAGQPAKGNWILRVKDLAFRDVGRLNAWRLELEVEG